MRLCVSEYNLDYSIGSNRPPGSTLFTFLKFLSLFGLKEHFLKIDFVVNTAEYL